MTKGLSENGDFIIMGATHNSRTLPANNDLFTMFTCRSLLSESGKQRGEKRKHFVWTQRGTKLIKLGKLFFGITVTGHLAKRRTEEAFRTNLWRFPLYKETEDRSNGC